jgi:hypothetical protein
MEDDIDTNECDECRLYQNLYRNLYLILFCPSISNISIYPPTITFQNSLDGHNLSPDGIYQIPVQSPVQQQSIARLVQEL